jgi:hypothetical protein
MSGSLKQNQIDQYWHDGLLYPIDILSGHEAKSFAAKFESLKTRMAPWCSSKQILKPHVVSTWVNQLVHHTNILNAVESLLGPNLLCWSATFFAKPPKTTGYVAWHQDITYWGLEPAQEVLTCWLALTEAREENGCMSMLPGSHETSLRNHKFILGTDNMLMGGQEVTLSAAELERTVSTELDIGQMSIHHSKTLHGSLGNHSSHPRIGLAIQYMPTSVQQVAAAGDAAMLVRGEDSYGHFAHEPSPVADFDSAALMAYQRTILTPGGVGRVDDNNPTNFINMQAIA